MQNWSNKDQADWNNICELAENNLRALELFSAYLHMCPTFVKREDISNLLECGVDTETAERLLVAAACGLDSETNVQDACMEKRYFQHAIHLLNAQECRMDPYYQTVTLPEIARGKWKMGYKTIRAFELFTSDDLKVMKDGREIPQTGFFAEDFRAPVVEENGREWMTVTPSEINTMKADINAAFGKVAVFGLGLGYYAFMISEKQNVTDVIVVERDPEVISLFKDYLLPQFPNKEKISIVEADAYTYADHMGDNEFDCVYVDIWHDVLDGVEMYLKMKRLEKNVRQMKYLYWIEPSLLAWLRGIALMEMAEGIDGPMTRTIGKTESLDELLLKLTDENLRIIAPEIPLSVAQR